MRCVLILRPAVAGQDHALIARLSEAESGLYRAIIDALCSAGAQSIEAVDALLSRIPFRDGTLMDALFAAGLVTTVAADQITFPEHAN